MNTNKRKILFSILIIIIFCAVIITTALLIFNNNKDVSSGNNNGNENGSVSNPDSGEEDGGLDDGNDDPIIIVSETDKALLLIANSDDEIYSKFEYFVDESGKIITEHISNIEFYDELETLCESLNQTISSRVGSNTTKITNDMYTGDAEIENVVNKIRDIFLHNAKF